MSQQEFFQEPQFQGQEQRSLEDDEIYYPPQPYYWSTKPTTEGTLPGRQISEQDEPKDEPMTSYDEPRVDDHQADYQHGYTSRDAIVHSYQQSSATKQSDRSIPFTTTSQAGSSRVQRQQLSPDGDSFERQYRPYGANNQQWSVPPWARPQQHRRNRAGLFWLVVLGLIFINPLLHILGVLLAIAGMIAFAVVLLLLFAAITGITYLLFRATTGRSSPRRGWRYNSSWRGPWGW